MNQKTILRDFQIVAESPGGIDGLRRLILTLGITGRLTSPSDDEQTSEIAYDLESLGLRNERIWGVESTEACPSTWVRLPLAKLGTWGSGGTPTRGNKEFYGGNIPWLVIGDLNDGIVLSATNSITEEGLRSSSATMIPVGAVLIAMYGSIGKSGIAGVLCTTNQAIAHCVPDERIISTAYLFQLMRGSRSRLISQGRGLAQKNISQTVLKHLVVAVPPLAEQERIVAKVDELMLLCDQLEEAQTKRDSIRTATRKSAIDTVATASTSQELDVAWKRISSNWDVMADTPESVKDLRQMIITLGIEGRLTGSKGSNWMPSTLGACVEIVRGITFPASAKRHAPEPGLIPCLRTANVQNEVVWTDLLYVSSDYVRNSNQLVKFNDLLISMANSRELVGKVAIVRRDDIECTLGGFIAALRVNDQLLPQYLLNILRVPASRERLIDSATQTTNIANISMGRLKPFELRLPPLAEQQQIVTKISELMALCDQLEKQLESRNAIAMKFARSVTASQSL